MFNWSLCHGQLVVVVSLTTPLHTICCTSVCRVTTSSLPTSMSTLTTVWRGHIYSEVHEVSTCLQYHLHSTTGEQLQPLSFVLFLKEEHIPMLSLSSSSSTVSLQKCLCVSSGDHTSGQLYRTFLTCPYSLNPHFFSSLAQVTASKHRPSSFHHVYLVIGHTALCWRLLLLQRREKSAFPSAPP